MAGDCDEKEVHKQEERRLFYVAMTRARDTLNLYGSFRTREKRQDSPGILARADLALAS